MIEWQYNVFSTQPSPLPVFHPQPLEFLKLFSTVPGAPQSFPLNTLYFSVFSYSLLYSLVFPLQPQFSPVLYRLPTHKAPCIPQTPQALCTPKTPSTYSSPTPQAPPIVSCTFHPPPSPPPKKPHQNATQASFFSWPWYSSYFTPLSISPLCAPQTSVCILCLSPVH